MNDFEINWIELFIFAVTVLIVGLVLGSLVGKEQIRREAVQQGHAIYNQTNRNFEWRQH